MVYEGRRNKLFLRKDLRLGEWVELRYVEMSDILQTEETCINKDTEKVQMAWEN